MAAKVLDKFLDGCGTLICTLSFIALSAFIYIQKFFTWLFSTKSPILGIPVIPSNSIFGFTELNGPTGHHNFWKRSKSCPIAQYEVLGCPMVALFDTKLAKQGQKIGGKGAPFQCPYDERLNEKCIQSINGQDWSLRKKILHSSFNEKAARSFIEPIQALVTKASDVLAKEASICSIVKMEELSEKFTFDTFMKVAFNYDLEALSDSTEYQKLRENQKIRGKHFWLLSIPWLHFLLNFAPVGPFARYQKATDACRAFHAKLIAHLKALREGGTLDPTCFGAGLLRLQDEHGLTDVQLMAEIQFDLLAAYETTSSVIGMLLYTMATNPDVQKRCQKEIDAWDASRTHSPSPADFAGLHSGADTIPEYLEATLKEVFRRFPPMGAGGTYLVMEKGGTTLRHAKEDGTEVVYKIPEGTWIYSNTWAYHRNTDYWGENALDFLPGRWLPNLVRRREHDMDEEKKSDGMMSEVVRSATAFSSGSSSAETDASSNPLSSPKVWLGHMPDDGVGSFVPFHGGPRQCPGMTLALIECRMVIAEFVRRFNFEVADESLRDEETALYSTVGIRVKDGLPLKVTERKKV